MKNRLMGGLAAVILAGCVAPQTAPPLAVKFSPEQHRPYLAAGDRKVTGQAFLRQKGGGVVTCAGAEVILFPDTPFFRGVIAQLLRRRAIAEADRVPQEFMQAVKRGQCDAQGRFAFYGLPDAGYVAVTKVIWRAGYTTEGGDVMKAVRSQGPNDQEAMLTSTDWLQ